MSKYIATYGTLRKGMYNNTRFPMEYITTVTLGGFQMYDLGWYPMVITTENPEDKVIFEVYKVDDDTYADITAMEIGAGYGIVFVDIPLEESNISATVYVYGKAPVDSTHIKNGDYVEYIRENKK